MSMSDSTGTELRFMGAPLRPISLRGGAMAALYALVMSLILPAVFALFGLTSWAAIMIFPVFFIGALVREAGLDTRRYPLQALVAIAIIWTVAMILGGIVRAMVT